MNKKFPIVEVFLSFVSIWWALVLFANSHMIDERIPAYLIELDQMEEYIWGVIFLTAAIMKFTALLTMNKLLRQLGLLASMVLYSLICYGYIASGNTIHTGTGVYFLLTVLAWYGLREVREDDKSKQS